MMMKKYASLLFALVLALSLSVSAAADADVYVYDDADILSTDECAALNEAGIAVSGLYAHKRDLEEFFVEMMGAEYRG